MAEQNPECLIDNNSNNKSVETPIKPGQRLKRKFVLTNERLEEICREDRIRRREKKVKKRLEGKEDSDDDDDAANENDEEYKAYTAKLTQCLVKPPCGHEAWLEYRDYLATQKAAAAAAATTSVCHDDVDAPAAGPEKILKVNEQEALEGYDAAYEQRKWPA